MKKIEEEKRPSLWGFVHKPKKMFYKWLEVKGFATLG